MDPVWRWWIGERGGAVCGERKQAGWARMGRLQELILSRVLFLFKGLNGFKIIIPSESSKTDEKVPNMHTPVRR